MAKGFIADKDFVPDSMNQGAAPSFVSDADFRPDDASQDEIKLASYQKLQSEYGSGIDPILAAAAGAARTATLGGSDIALTESGLVKPETLRGLKEANPGASFAGDIGGGAALIGFTGGAGALAPAIGGTAARLGAGAATAKALGTIGAMGVEGAAFNVGSGISEDALGESEMNAQKLAADIGIGFLFGAGLGVAGKGLEKLVPSASSKAGSVTKAVKKMFGAGEEELAVMPREGGVVDPILEKTGVKPESIDEIAQIVRSAKEKGSIVEAPQKISVLDADAALGTKYPALEPQLKSLESQGERDAYNIIREMPGKEGDAIRAYESLQKDELVYKLEGEIKKLSPSEMPEKDAIKNGESAIKKFTDQYQKEKEELTPIFESFKDTSVSNVDHMPGMINKMSESVPGVSGMFEVAEGKVKVLPYSETGGGIDKATYNAAKEVFKFLNAKKKPKTVRDLLDIRKSLDQNIDILAQGQAPSEIRALKSGLMDYIQETSSNPEIRDALRRYAVNEQERGVIEKTFGASVGKQEFGALSKVKPEEVLDKVFRNTANIKAAKTILEPEVFNKMTADWLSSAKEAATDKGVFSSNKFNSWLRRNEDSLSEAIKDSPALKENFKHILNKLRALPDAPSINPSGTAKTLLGMLDRYGTNPVGGVLSFLKDKTIGGIENAIKMQNLDEQLKGRAANHTVLSKISESLDKFNKKMTSQVNSIFTNDYKRGAVGSTVMSTHESHYDKNVKKIQEFSSNPQMMGDHIAKTIQPINGSAPNISQGLSNVMVAGVGFLASKMPRPNNELPLSGKWEPTKSQKTKFNRYFEAVNNPLSALAEIKNGSLSNETMEALEAVHPHLLEQMQQKLMEQLSNKKAQSMSYAKKIALSKFLQMPLEEGMIPQVLLANQAIYMMPPRQSGQAPVGSHRVTQSGMKSIDLSQRMKTDTDRRDDS
jgi:tellurite resistance-related uncharacterized protein